MNLKPIFCNCYSELDLNLNLNKIEEYCYEVKKIDQGVTVSNYGGWHSNNRNSGDDHEKKLFIDSFTEKVNEFSASMGIKVPLKIDNFWININKKRDFNKIHTHMRSIVSGVFYVKVNKNSGRLVFENPFSEIASCYLDYWHMKSDEHYIHNEITSNIWHISPENGKIVLFPSWTGHYVEPNESEEDRISISFNTSPLRN